MVASKENPVYTVFVVDGSTKYDLTPSIISIDSKDQEKQISHNVNIEVMNVQVNGRWMTSIIKVRQRVFVYANDGERNEEVFRGYVWSRGYKSGLEARALTIRCYDNLIYFQESEDSEYFPEGKSTKDIVSALCQKWGVQLEYKYESITHTKLPLRGTLSNIFTADVLDLVKDRTGKKYVIRSEKDTMKVLTVGQNEKIYNIKAKENAIETQSECTMDGMVTKVIILGKADKDERLPVEATVSQKTDQYGTLQKIISRDENTTLEDSKKEAQNILKNGGEPKWTYEIRMIDIPWMRKGDKVHVSAGDIYDRDLIITGITRSIEAKGCQMSLSLERP